MVQASDAMSEFKLTVQYGKETAEVVLAQPEPTLGQLAEAIEQAIPGISRETSKLVVKGKSVHLGQSSNRTLGLKSGTKVMLLGSKPQEVQAVVAAKEPSRMPGFEHEEALASVRRARTARDVGPPPPGTRYTFGGFKVLQAPGLYPAPSEALKLLHRLAADPGIRAVMEKHQYEVGQLAEMPPHGMVGVDPVCVLGVNHNRGQLIELRLRTDDLKGFRKYESIRATLCHELTHNVWGDHDSNFKALCSQLNREVAEVEARMRQGGQLALSQGVRAGYLASAAARREEEDEEGVAVAALHPAMAATSASSGKTLRQLAKETRAAGAGAQRPQTLQPQAVTAAPVAQLSVQGPGAPALPQGHGVVAGTGAAQGTGEQGHRAVEAEGADAVAQQGQAAGASEEDVATMYEHRDAASEAQEARMRALEE